MKKIQSRSFLHLEDGSTYQGWSFLNSFKSIGEVIFNTGMTGYQEIMTDPSYHNQIILFTYPEIGNTGTNILDMESDVPIVKGVIAKNISEDSSNWRNCMSLIDYLVYYDIPHIFGIDTRYLTKKIREKGVMVGCISSKRLNNYEANLDIESFNSSTMHAINYVSTKKIYQWFSQPLRSLNCSFYSSKILSETSLTVVVIDYGVKFNILNKLAFYGCNIIVVPSKTSYQSIFALNPDGVLLSNGPGDPSAIDITVFNVVKQLVISNLPVFGICLGHQLLNLAFGGKTYKLKYGHRGLNHPSGEYDIVKMTSQNHGYVVSLDTISHSTFSIYSFNCNDQTIAGTVHSTKPCFSVQYHPEASPGPHDTDFLFDHFIEVMLSCKR